MPCCSPFAGSLQVGVPAHPQAGTCLIMTESCKVQYPMRLRIDSMLSFEGLP